MEKMREEILLPALRKASLDRKTVIRAAALMALGKVGDFESFQVLFRGTADRDKDVRKAALLGLSYLGTTEVTLVLERTLLDEREDTQVRAFAAGSLGLVTAPGSSAVLVWATDERRPVDVRGAAILALGFYEDEHSRKALVDLYRNTRDDPRIRSMAIGSLGRRGEVENVKTLIAALRDKKVDVRRAAALGLGAIRYMGKAEQWLAMAREARLAWNERHELTPEARKSLEETIERFEALAKAEETKYRRIRKSAARRLIAATEKESDLQTRAFALISLAEIGSTECITPIRKILDRKSHRLLGWAGIAAGVSGDKSLVPYLRKGFLRAGTDPSNRAAMALGLGMLEDHGVADDLGRVARDPGADPDLRGYSITALALMPHRSILSVIDDVLATKGNPSLHRNAALALGVAGRAGSGKRLVALMDGTNDLYVKAAATIGLGYLREPTSAKVLADAASNRDNPFLARLYGVLAVGYLGDRQSAPPTLSRLAWFYNYRVSIPAVDRLTSLL
jgi:HEAT repeat protein